MNEIGVRFGKAVLLKKQFLKLKGSEYKQETLVIGTVVDLIVFRISDEYEVRFSYNSGTPLTHPNGDPLGLIVLMNESKIQHAGAIELALESIAGRISQELAAALIVAA